MDAANAFPSFDGSALDDSFFDPGPPLWRHPASCLPSVELPDGDLPTRPLGDAIGKRISCRRYGGDPPMSLSDLAVLLRGTYGVLGEVELWGDTHRERPVPSGGARYPLEMYVLARRVDGLERGLWGFDPFAVGDGSGDGGDGVGDPRAGRLVHLRGPLPWGMVAMLFMGQPWLLEVDCLVVLTAIPARTLLRYGERGIRFLWLEAGHAAQNLQLLATACDLGSLSLGGFQDAQLSAFLGLATGREMPLYGVAVGRPEVMGRVDGRTPNFGFG